MTSIDLSTAGVRPATSNWKESMSGIMNALAYPDRFFRPQMNLAFALAPITAVVLLKVILVRAQLPYLFEAILRTLPADAAERFLRDGNSLLKGRLWIQYMGAVTMPLITIAFMAVVLYLLIVAFGAITNYATVFSTTAYLWLIQSLKAAFSFFLMAAKGMNAIRGPESLEPPVGLGLLIHHHGMLQRVADLGNVFDIWFVAAATIAVRRMTPLSKKGSVAVAIVWWATLQVFRLGTTFAFQQITG